jgi:hypothetical protein
MPVSSGEHLSNLSDDLVMKVTVVIYNDAVEALIKAIGEARRRPSPQPKQRLCRAAGAPCVPAPVDE